MVEFHDLGLQRIPGRKENDCGVCSVRGTRQAAGRRRTHFQCARAASGACTRSAHDATGVRSTRTTDLAHRSAIDLCSVLRFYFRYEKKYVETFTQMDAIQFGYVAAVLLIDI